MTVRPSVMRSQAWFATALVLILFGVTGQLDGQCGRRTAGDRTVDDLERLTSCDSLVDFLERCDGATDDTLIARALDLIAERPSEAAPLASKLVRLLEHRCAIYAERDKSQVVRLRARTFVTLAKIGFPSTGTRHLLDVLAHPDDRLMPLELGAAVRAAGSMGEQGREFIPHLVQLLVASLSREEFSLERYAATFSEAEATTVVEEVARALGNICIDGDAGVLNDLQRVADDQQGEYGLRCSGAALRAIAQIRSRHSGPLIQPKTR